MDNNDYDIGHNQSGGIVIYEHRGKVGDVGIIIMSLSKDPTDESKWLDADNIMKMESFAIEKINKKNE